MTQSPYVAQLQASLEFEPRVNLHRCPVHVAWRDGKLVLDGGVDSIVAKRVAARIARDLAGRDTVLDQLQIQPAEARPDGDMLDALTRSLLAAPDLRNCVLRRRHRSETQSLRSVGDSSTCGDVCFAVTNGVIELDGHVISLSHRRVIEALAWWVPGCRSVENRLRVEPAEDDNDDELADAVRQVLEMDPILSDSGQIGVSARLRVVTLHGAVHEAAQKRRAEQDAWSVDGVNEVLNALEVMP